MHILALAILAIAMLCVAESARAQTYDPNYPVCLRGGYIDCSYTSLAQCNATASGRGAECLINPYFANGPAGRPGLRSRGTPVY